MQTLTLKSNEVRYYTLDIPDENYSKVVELLGKPLPASDEIITEAIKRYPVQFLTSQYFSEELQSLCECDITDEYYELTSDDVVDDVDA